MSAVFAIGNGVASLENANNESQIMTAFALMWLVLVNTQYLQSANAQLNADENTYYIDTLDTVGNPSEAAAAAAAYATYLQDENALNLVQSQQNTMIQNAKDSLAEENTTMQNGYKMEQPMAELLASTAALIAVHR
jgi:hypothetical protein